jgi:hypothetical protein
MPERVVTMVLGPLDIRIEHVGVGVEGAKPHEAVFTATVKIDYDELEFSFIVPSTLTDRDLIIFVLGWLLEARDMEDEDFVKQVFGPEPDPAIEEVLAEKANETVAFARKWGMEIQEATRRFGPEVRDRMMGAAQKRAPRRKHG